MVYRVIRQTYVSPTCKCSSSNILTSHLLGKSTKVHLYYCMKNCAQSAAHLRDSIVKHYQVSCSSTIHVCVHVHVHTQCSTPSVLQTCTVYSLLCILICIQNQRANCHQDSPCRHPRYSPTKIQLTSPAAIEAYEKALKATLIYMYKNVEFYCRVRNLCWCCDQSNHVYVPK